MTRQIKTCRCCGTQAASTKQRVCRECKGRRFDVRDETEVEASERETKVANLNKLLESLVR